VVFAEPVGVVEGGLARREVGAEIRVAIPFFRWKDASKNREITSDRAETHLTTSSTLWLSRSSMSAPDNFLAKNQNLVAKEKMHGNKDEIGFPSEPSFSLA
jgi:hypothetical protein